MQQGSFQQFLGEPCLMHTVPVQGRQWERLAVNRSTHALKASSVALGSPITCKDMPGHKHQNPGRVRAPQPVHLLLGSQSYARMDCLVCAYDGSKNGSTESSGLTCASQLDHIIANVMQSQISSMSSTGSSHEPMTGSHTFQCHQGNLLVLPLPVCPSAVLCLTEAPGQQTSCQQDQ